MSLPGTASRRIAIEVQSRIEADQNRERRRRPKDAQTFVALVDMITANLVRFHLKQADTEAEQEGYLSGGILWLGILLARKHLGSKRRYDAAPVPQWLRTDIINAMDRLDLLILDKAPRHPDATRPSFIRPGPVLLDLIEAHAPTLADFAEADGGEVICLRGNPVEVFVRSRNSGKHVPTKAPGTLIDYRDTDQTKKWRRELEAANAWLQQAEITYDPALAIADHIRLHGEPPRKPLPQSIALHERRMYRVFNRDSFGSGGRLAGPFWLTMPGAARLGLRVATEAAPEGEPFVSLDYTSMFLQLLYTVKEGQQTPLEEGDLYEGIIGEGGEYGAPWPNNPAERVALRSAIKVNVNTLLFREPDSGPRRSITKGTRHRIDPETDKPITTEYIIPKDISSAELDRRICRRHPSISHWFGTDIGHELMFHESEIMMGILRMCREKGVVVLPLHDGLLVPQSQWQIAREAMHLAFYMYTEGFAEIVDGPKAADG